MFVIMFYEGECEHVSIDEVENDCTNFNRSCARY